MSKLDRQDLFTLEDYARVRREFRSQVLAHKKDRKLELGPIATLYFEDRLTIQYQIQEMLRIERIFEPEGIQNELDAYNPLIPDGSNWKATFMVEIPDIEERRRHLAQLIGIEDRIWVQVGDQDRVYAIADEDLDRENAEKTSSVHFLRFELSPGMREAVKAGTEITLGLDHPNYSQTCAPVPQALRDSLAQDLS